MFGSVVSMHCWKVKVPNLAWIWIQARLGISIDMHMYMHHTYKKYIQTKHLSMYTNDMHGSIIYTYAATILMFVMLLKLLKVWWLEWWCLGYTVDISVIFTAVIYSGLRSPHNYIFSDMDCKFLYFCKTIKVDVSAWWTFIWTLDLMHLYNTSHAQYL